VLGDRVLRAAHLHLAPQRPRGFYEPSVGHDRAGYPLGPRRRPTCLHYGLLEQCEA
jgi:hypothetical protein